MKKFKSFYLIFHPNRMSSQLHKDVRNNHFWTRDDLNTIFDWKGTCNYIDLLTNRPTKK